MPYFRWWAQRCMEDLCMRPINEYQGSLLSPAPICALWLWGRCIFLGSRRYGKTVWIAIKHFRKLQRQLTGLITRDYFTGLMKTHVRWQAPCLQWSQRYADLCLSFAYRHHGLRLIWLDSLDIQIYIGILQSFWLVQMFVLGLRLILSLREYRAKFVDNSDAETDMTSIFSRSMCTRNAWYDQL